MADLITYLCQIATTELHEAPQATTQQLADRLKRAVEQNQALQAALQSDDRLIQINQGDVTAFQTLVSGGIANIGVHLHGADEAKLIEIVREVLRSFQPVGIPQNLPSNGTATFVGREADMAALHDQLQQSERVVIASIHGMGGIGKTELALQYALRHFAGKLYPGGVCWLRSREEVGTQIVSFARSQLGLQPPEDLELLEQVRWCWRNWQAGEVLAVFDDVQQYADVEAFLPPAGEPRFKVLMTTRLLKVAKSVQNFEIKVLDEASALNLLRAIVLDGRIDQDLETAKRLCEWLGYLPLGLELVGQYLEHDEDIELSSEDENCPGLWQRLQKARLDAIALKETYSGMTATDGVAAAFELSWQQLDEAEQRLATLLSLFALAEIPWVHVQSCLPNLSVEELERLRNRKLLGLHLLQRTGKGMYQLHQLIREFFAAKRSQRADRTELQQSFCQVMVTIAGQIPQTTTVCTIENLIPIMPHLKEVATVLSRCLTDKKLMIALTHIGWFYQGQAAYEEAEKWYEQSCAIIKKRLGNNNVYVAATLTNLGAVYRFQGRYSEAEKLHLQALQIRQQQLGSNHLHVANSLNNLAALYESVGQYVRAESFYIQALETRRQQLGEDHCDVAQVLNNLANLYRLQGRYSEAQTSFKRSLEIWRQQLGDDHPEVAQGLNNLASLHVDQGDYSEAEISYLQALQIRQQQLGDSHPDVAQTLHNLATLYTSQGRYSEAESLLKQCLQIWQHRLGSHHTYLAISLNGLGELYRLQEYYSEAESLFLQALQILNQQLNVDHPYIATTLNNLALCYSSQGRNSEAELFYLQSLSIRRQQLGVNHPDVAASLNNLALCYQSQERYSEAELLYIQAIVISCERLGEHHVNTKTFLSNFIAFLQQMIQSNLTLELSTHPMTTSLLQKLQPELDAKI
ncbi:tetratricopeptide repeat protein [Leptolyngbya sp. NIES-2104]|uniref:tetratricopeptide repeat protein n=1 Tax=Leptolyngbya sp. NIES-2104 TaxID=1552121 RepID=UPI0006EC9C58|nr:tetratricopeptide repeat protein [Leptolyngbya sp. NIES-2104]GAP99709.1 kinesin light chain [Leptolyngbya sp. NIES-2104]